MKTKYILVTLLFLSVTYTAEAQFFKKLKKKAQEAAERTIIKKTDEVVSKKTEKTIDDATTKKQKTDNNQQKNSNEDSTTGEGTNPALSINTELKKDFYKEDLILTTYEDSNKPGQIQYFDADQVAARIETDPTAKPSYVDSEGFIYAFKDGEYTKSSFIALQSQGMMMPTMMLEAYKLPPEPVMANLQKQTDLGMTANPFNGVIEFAFVYKPEHFRYEDFEESKQSLKGKTYTRFGFLNEPGYENSYVLFDSKDRLVEIFVENTNDNQDAANTFEMGFSRKGKALLTYQYKPVEVNLPPAREVRAQGQGLMEGVMNNIVKGGNQPKNDIDEDDYDTSDMKGSTKAMKKAIKNHKATKADLPDTYEFDWKYQVELLMGNKGKDKMDMTFLIKEGATYQATQIVSEQTKDMGEVTMLFDMNLNVMAMFMKAQGKKYVSLYPISKAKQNTTNKEYTITELPSKAILGFACKGLQLEDDRYIMKVYHTTEAKITLSNFLSFGNAKNNMNLPEIDPRLIKQFSNSLIMEMQMEDKKKSKNNVSVIAKSLTEKSTKISKNNYIEMNLFGGAAMLKN